MLYFTKEENEQVMQTVPGLSFNTDVLIIIRYCPISQGCDGIMVLYLLLIFLAAEDNKPGVLIQKRATGLHWQL